MVLGPEREREPSEAVGLEGSFSQGPADDVRVRRFGEVGTALKAWYSWLRACSVNPKWA